MITSINISSWSQGSKTLPGRLWEEWDVWHSLWALRGCFQLCCLYSSWAASPSLHSTPPIYSLGTYKSRYSSSSSLHDTASFWSYVERWSQQAKSLASFQSTAENDKFMANHWVLSCKLEKVQSRAIWQSLLPPSESLSHFKISLCFPSKLGTHGPQTGKSL